MKIAFSISFLLIAQLLVAQTKLPDNITEENIDSIMCPKMYAALDSPYQSFFLKNKDKSIDNKSLNGKIVFINFWFEGCPPCIAEMDALNKMYKALKDQKDFVFISICRDDEKTIQRVKEKYDLEFDIFSISKEECSRLNFRCGYPNSIILDKEGRIKYYHTGGSIKKAEAENFVMTVYLQKIKNLL